ncbi:hypothetical protein E2C01_000627 [Portunus trituberculatus]|uniref:Uncharacterized protein n=1 Tax=Portunus trituberculatus TaxID=210409 RepID=A0A5B7CHY9_PORTR|nr:hypothetical protein [Portunus trituberculatus]
MKRKGHGRGGGGRRLREETFERRKRNRKWVDEKQVEYRSELVKFNNSKTRCHFENKWSKSGNVCEVVTY